MFWCSVGRGVSAAVWVPADAVFSVFQSGGHLMLRSLLEARAHAPSRRHSLLAVQVLAARGAGYAHGATGGGERGCVICLGLVGARSPGQSRDRLQLNARSEFGLSGAVSRELSKMSSAALACAKSGYSRSRGDPAERGRIGSRGFASAASPTPEPEALTIFQIFAVSVSLGAKPRMPGFRPAQAPLRRGMRPMSSSPRLGRIPPAMWIALVRHCVPWRAWSA